MTLFTERSHSWELFLKEYIQYQLPQSPITLQLTIQAFFLDQIKIDDLTLQTVYPYWIDLQLVYGVCRLLERD